MPPVPGDIRSCFKKITPAPSGTGRLTENATVRLITKLRKSEIRKTHCGRRLIRIYDGVRREVSR